MKPNPGPGKLIALEGLDGAGTTTQSALLADWLRRHRSQRVYVTQEPSRGPAGAQIRSVLSRRLAMDGRTLAALFAADRLDHLYHLGGVVERLEAGEWVIMDRYYLSSFAYQALSLNELELHWLWHLHSPCIVPDTTIFLDVPVDVCLERIGFNRSSHFELFEKKDTLQAVREKYLEAFQQFRRVGHNVQIVAGVRSAEIVTQVIQNRLVVFWNSNRLPPEEYASLWRQWPVLRELQQSVEQRLGLSLLTINRLPGDKKSRSGYQLVFVGAGSAKYTVMAYRSRGTLDVFVQGPEDDIKRQLTEITRRPSL